MTTKKVNRKTILALGWVSFFMDVSSEMIYPLLPIFMASTLGVGALTIGIVAGFSESIASFFRIFSGVLSDRFQHRKGIVLAGYSISALSRIVLALSNTWSQVLGFRLLDRAGKGLRTPPRDALISDSATEDTYGRYYGYHRAMDTAGAVLGPTIAFLVISSGYALGKVFWLSLVPALIAIAVLYIFVTETRKGGALSSARTTTPEISKGGTGYKSAEENKDIEDQKKGAAGSKDSYYESIKQGITPEAKVFLFITAIFSLGNSSNFFIILKAKNLGFNAAMIPLLYVSMNISYALFAYPAGRLADRYGKATLTLIGYFAYAVAYALFAVHFGARTMWALLPFYGLYLGLTDGVNRAYMATLLPEEKKATGFALYHTVIGISLLPASILGGWLWDNISPALTFLTGSAFSLVAGILFGVLLFRLRRQGITSAHQ